MRNKTRKSTSSIGILFWIALILLFIIIFFANKQTIDQVLEETQFLEIIRPAKSDALTVTINGEEQEVVGYEEEITGSKENNAGENSWLDSLESSVISDIAANTNPLGASSETLPAAVEEVATLLSSPLPEQDLRQLPEDQTEQRQREGQIYYAQVSDAGVIYIKAVKRSIPYTNNPLTETINTLLQGPTQNETQDGFINLIPTQAKLLSAWVKDGVAYLDFNDAFMFNTFGSEGSTAQLQQIIYSTTEFSTVDKVQILIEGEKIEYLSQEGVFIGEPLSRNS